jgi:hypothetical protein
MTKNKSYQEGFFSSKKGLNWVDNPYSRGSVEWQSWIKGRGVYGEILLDKLIKNTEKILKKLRGNEK